MQLNETMKDIKLIVDEISLNNNKSKELIVAKIYLENNINRKHIEYIYNEINNINFINLENDYNIIINDNTWKNNNDILYKKFEGVINELNNNNINKFNEELKKYKIILEEKLNKEFYTKKNLEDKINLLFSEGLKSLNDDSKKQIYDILDTILNKLKNHILNEGNRLSIENSYNNDITVYYEFFPSH